MNSPTTRTLKLLKEEGYATAVVEKWNPHARIRQDLFGCIDILAIKEGEILGVQTTSTSNMQARVAKSIALPALRLWFLAGGTFEVWGWSKMGKKGKRKLWTVKKEVLTPANLG